MTDNEVIKALECCLSDSPPCAACKYDDNTFIVDECMGELMKDALDLIYRQKAEIERYREVVGELAVAEDGTVTGLLNGKETKFIDKEVAETLKNFAVSSARKEFAERASLIMVQFMMDELRIFIKDKCHDLDAVNDFNPTTEDLQGYVQSARKYLDIDNLLEEMESERE